LPGVYDDIGAGLRQYEHDVYAPRLVVVQGSRTSAHEGLHSTSQQKATGGLEVASDGELVDSSSGTDGYADDDSDVDYENNIVTIYGGAQFVYTSFGPQNTATEQPLTEKQAAVVYNAEQFALLKLLLHKECRDYIAGNTRTNAFDALSSLWNNKQFTYFNGTQFSSEEGPGNIAASRGGLMDKHTSLVRFYQHRIVLGYLFFQDNVGGFTSSQNISTLAAQAEVILHELRHYLTGIGHPKNAKPEDPESEESWAKNLYDKCNFANKK
jgi:hypothetical protein